VAAPGAASRRTLHLDGNAQDAWSFDRIVLALKRRFGRDAWKVELNEAYRHDQRLAAIPSLRPGQSARWAERALVRDSRSLREGRKEEGMKDRSNGMTAVALGIALALASCKAETVSFTGEWKAVDLEGAYFGLTLIQEDSNISGWHDGGLADGSRIDVAIGTTNPRSPAR
jgi:hypothetical protein